MLKGRLISHGVDEDQQTDDEYLLLGKQLSENEMNETHTLLNAFGIAKVMSRRAQRIARCRRKREHGVEGLKRLRPEKGAFSRPAFM